MVTRSGHPFDSLRSLRAGRLPAVILFFVLFSGAIPSLAAGQFSIDFYGGPTIVVAKFSDAPELGSELHAGGSYLFGFRHKDGFFTEFRIAGGGSYVPSLKIGAGWSIEIKSVSYTHLTLPTSD